MYSPLTVYIFIASNYGRQVFLSTVRQRRGRQLLKCVVPEHIHTPPPRRAICFRSQPPGIPFQEVFVKPPHPPPPPAPRNSVIFQLSWVPSGKNVCVKNIVALYYHTTDFFWGGAKMRKIFSFMLLAECILETNYPSEV